MSPTAAVGMRMMSVCSTMENILSMIVLSMTVG
jgi:hypothetical protein